MRFRGLSLIVLALAVFGCSAPDDAETNWKESTSSKQNEAVLSEVIALTNDRKLDEAFQLYSSDFIYHGPAGIEMRGRDEIRGMWEEFLTGFPDMQSTVEEFVSNGDRVTMRWRIDGTHTGYFQGIAPSNNSMTLGIMEIFRFEDGQIAEVWDQYDRLDLMQQIGALPEPE